MADAPLPLTRRRLVQTGLAGAATVGLGSIAFESVATAAAQANPELLRSTYLSLTSNTFTAQTADGVRQLELVAVEDLAIATSVPALRDSDNAFSVRFRGAVLPPSRDVLTLAHPEIGEFPLFISPVDPLQADGQDYEAVVDSVIQRVHVSEAGTPAPVDPGVRAVSEPPQAVTQSRSRNPAALKGAQLHRSAHRRSVIADLAFAPSPRVKVVRAVLRRHGKVVGRTTGVVSGGRVKLRFTAKHHRARAGAYEIVIVAVDAQRHTTTLRVPLRLA